MHLTLNDVGDGLFQELEENNHVLITDFGSQQNIEHYHVGKFFDLQESLKRVDFALTHFHKDHYSGLFEIAKQSLYTNFTTVYLPRLPQQPAARTLFFALQTVQMFTMGSYSGSMDFDFLYLVRQLNQGNFVLRPVSQGDQIALNGKSFQVSWPPRQLNKSTLVKIHETLQEFESQIEEIRPLRNLYNKMRQSDSIWIIDEGGEVSTIHRQQRITPEKFDVSVLSKEQRHKLSKLNRKLRNAANCLSLCYFDNDINFLGDLESEEIDRCIQYLATVAPGLTWDNIILPHHGTHWHNSMYRLTGFNGLSSNGRKMISYWNTRNQDVCWSNYTTYIDGELNLTV